MDRSAESNSRSEMSASMRSTFVDDARQRFLLALGRDAIAFLLQHLREPADGGVSGVRSS